MYDRILVPTDGSTGSAHVAMQALNLAEHYDATVYAIHIVDRSVRMMMDKAGKSSEVLQEQGERAVGLIERMAANYAVTITTEIREGDPAETILAYAAEIEADVIVAGTHGRTGIERHLLGSVAERLVRHASCPVLTVRLPETDVTVEDAHHAKSLLQDAIEKRGYDAEISDVERQLTVWVGQAKSDEGNIVVYLDPVTQRTSVLPQFD